MAEHEWLMREIAKEIIKERLGLDASGQNVTALAKLLHEFDLEVTGRYTPDDTAYDYGQLISFQTARSCR